MNTHTGEIQSFPTAAAAKAAGYTRQIPLEDRPKVQGMTRRQRLAWAAELRESELAAAHRSKKKFKQRERASR